MAEIITAGRMAVRNVAPGLVQIIVSCSDSGPAADISTADGCPWRVIWMISWVLSASSTRAELLLGGADGHPSQPFGVPPAVAGKRLVIAFGGSVPGVRYEQQKALRCYFSSATSETRSMCSCIAAAAAAESWALIASAILR